MTACGTTPVLSSAFTPACPLCASFTNQETLTLDGAQQAVSAVAAENGNWADLDFGAGYIGGTWPNEANQGKAGAIQYLNGQMADVQLFTGTSGYQVAFHATTGHLAIYDPANNSSFDTGLGMAPGNQPRHRPTFTLISRSKLPGK